MTGLDPIITVGDPHIVSMVEKDRVFDNYGIVSGVSKDFA
jgi:hypothetical protein